MDNESNAVCGFREGLTQDPADWNLRLIYADWLENNDREEEAFAQRWMATRRKCPSYRDDRQHWCWVRAGEGSQVLGDSVFYLLPGARSQYHTINAVWYMNLQEAEDQLTLALTQMRKLLEIP